MSTFDWKTIPSATELREEIMQSKQKKIEEEAEKQRKKDETFKEIAGAYINSMKNAFYEALNTMRKEYSTLAIFYPLDLRHYMPDCKLTFIEVHHNKYDDEYYEDEECISPIFKNLFKDIQKELFQKGYYLLQSDKNFILSIGKPDGYDKEPVLWHGFNKITLDL